MKTYFLQLNKQDIKNLGEFLGLSQKRLNDHYDSSKSIYLDSVVDAWFGKVDNVQGK